MEAAEKKAWLERYVMAVREAERLRDELVMFRSYAECLGGSVVPANGGHGGRQNPMADAVEQVLALEEELAGQLRECVALRRQMERVLAAVPDEGLRQVLKLRYISGLGWEHVAERLCYGVRQVSRLHARALGMVEI